MALTECFAILLGYSGGAVPDSHQVPCCVGSKTGAADHQRTLTARNVSPLKSDVNRAHEKEIVLAAILQNRHKNGGNSCAARVG